VFEGIERMRPPIAAAVAAAKPKTLPGVVFATKYTAIADIADRDSVRWFELPYAAEATEFPAELLELPNLELLEVSRTPVAAIPPAIGALRRLRRLDISWCNGLEDLPEELFGIETLSYIQMYDCFGLRNAFHMGRVNHLLGGFVRARTPSRRRIVETNLFLARDRRALELASDADLLAALDSNVAAVRDSALRCLATRVPDRLGEPLAAGSSFALIGKTNFEKARIAAAVTVSGAALTTKITGATTHVIVGAQPGGKQSRRRRRHRSSPRSRRTSSNRSCSRAWARPSAPTGSSRSATPPRSSIRSSSRRSWSRVHVSGSATCSRTAHRRPSRAHSRLASPTPCSTCTSPRSPRCRARSAPSRVWSSSICPRII
jgi:Leucine-rich repeat (LRR) protein